VRSPEPIVAPPGDEVVFECSLNVPAEQVRWRHDGRFLHRNHGNETSSSGLGNHSTKSSHLVVRVHDEHQAGDYQVGINCLLVTESPIPASTAGHNPEPVHPFQNLF
jgi:hypothetical protein